MVGILTQPAALNMNTAIFLEIGYASLQGGNLVINPNSISTYGFNVLVAGNIIQAGNATLSNGGGVASYLYSSAFTTVGVTATLQDNVFSGVGDGTVSPSPGTVNILNICGALCKITNNSLVRGMLSLASYINNATFTAPQDLYIVDNIFDSNTIDGVNIYPTGSAFALVAGGLTNTSTYTQNINQTCTSTISLADYLNYVNTAESVPFLNPTGPAIPEIFADIFGFNNGATPGAGPLVISRATGSYVGSSYLLLTISPNIYSPSIAVSFTVPLDTTLPLGVKIVSLQIGAWLQESGPSLDTGEPLNEITLGLARYGVINTNGTPATPPGGTNPVQTILDVMSNTTTPELGILNDNQTGAIITTFTTVIVGNSATTSFTSSYQQVQEQTIAHATQYCTLSPLTPYNNLAYGSYAVGGNFRLSAEVNISLKSNGTGSNFGLALSPIVITYQW